MSEIQLKEDTIGSNLQPVSFFQLFKYSKPIDKLFITIGVIAALIASFSGPTLTVLYGKVIDAFVKYENWKLAQNLYNKTKSVTNHTSDGFTTEKFMSDIYFLSTALLIGWFVTTLANYALMTFFPLSAINQIHTIKGKYFESILKQEISWFEKSSGDFASRVSLDLNRLEDGLNEKLGMALYSIAAVVLNLGLAFIYGWKLTLVLLAISPFIAFSTAIVNKTQATFARKQMESYASAGNVAEEVISAIRTVYAFGGETKEVERYEQKLMPAMRNGITRSVITGLGNAVLYLCIYFGMALGNWFGVKQIIEAQEDGSESYTVGSVTIVFWSVLAIGSNIGAATPHMEAINMARGTAAMIYSLIERKSKIDSSSESGEKPNSFNSNIEFRNVGFSYPMRPEVKILDGINLKINCGERVALVGPSGCGKSTLIQLIQRFYEPVFGNILIDGHDIQQLNLGWLREQMGVVGQEPVLFDTTIRENISLGSHRKDITDEDIELAAIESNAQEFISKLPKGLNTCAGDRGTQLSGGQKQRIAIARALINRPKLLLLDEATSALDLQSEALVQTALDRASKGRTTIIVAHRLSTIVNSDRIVFIESGKVMEMGSHSELMAKRGLYFNAVITQQMNCKNTKNSGETTEDIFHDIDLNPKSYEPTLGTLSSSGTSLVNSEPMESNDSKSGISSFSQIRLLKLLSMDKYYILFGLFCSILYGLVVPIYSYIFGLFVNAFAQHSTDPQLIHRSSITYSLYYVALAIGVGIVSFAQISMLGTAGERLTMRLRKMAFEAILRQEIEWFDCSENSTGALCARLSADAANVEGACGSRLSIICQTFTTFVTSAIVGFILNWRLSFVACAFIPFIVIGGALAGSVQSGKEELINETNEMSTKIAIETIGSIRTVASLHQEMHFISKYLAIIENNLRTARRKCYFRAFLLALSLSIYLLAYAVVFLYGGLLITKDQIITGDFFIVIETLLYSAITVGQSMVFTGDYHRAKVALVNIFALIDRKPISAADKQTVTESPKQFGGNITFSGTFFTYPNRPGVQILNGLSFNVSNGQTVALVGSSGCGKSTTIQLLEKFYTLSGGGIFLDGIDINTLDTQWVRSQMALVSQEPILFSYSIRDNIAYGDNTRSVTMDQIVSAAQKANIHSFIKDLPNGYDTYVGNKGNQLSGGQKQRIAIARALIRNPKILLLDEATSALDTASEQLVQTALDEASKGRTCLVIAHRLTTIQKANRIVVIQSGVSAEEGIHEQLIQRKGIYCDLYSVQKQ